jgi:hypothetical protein
MCCPSAYEVKTHVGIGQAALDEFKVEHGDPFVERLVQVAAVRPQAVEKQEAALPVFAPPPQQY